MLGDKFMNSNVEIIEVRWHGRGGQGAVTAAELLAKAAYIDGYKDVQAFPFFGAERRGAPVTAFTRISSKKIHLRSQIYNPDVVVVLDPSLLGMVNVLEGLRNGGMLVVNISKQPEELLEMGIPPKYKIATVDATKIALDLGLKVAGIPVLKG